MKDCDSGRPGRYSVQRSTDSADAPPAPAVKIQIESFVSERSAFSLARALALVSISSIRSTNASTASLRSAMSRHSTISRRSVRIRSDSSEISARMGFMASVSCIRRRRLHSFPRVIRSVSNSAEMRSQNGRRSLMTRHRNPSTGFFEKIHRREDILKRTR